MPLNAAWYYSQCVERPYYPCAALSPHSRLSGAMVEETERSFLVICHAGRAQMRCICCQPSPAGFNNPR